MRPEVSVVMAVFNGGSDLRSAIESVLSQSHRDFEFIIVNDGSTDGSLETIRSFDDERIRVLDQQNRGLSESLNRGIAVARGNLIARMDSDDISHPERFAEQVAYLRSNEGCVAVGANANYIDANGCYLYTSRCALTWDEIRAVLPRSPFFHSSVMFRKTAFEAAGGYIPEISQFFEDQVLWNRMARHGELINLPSVLLDYRIGPGAITQSKQKGHELIAICARVIARGFVDADDRDTLAKFRQRRPSARAKLAGYHLRIGKIYLEHAFNRWRAMKHLFLSAWLYPASGKTWFNIGLSLLPSSWVRSWKSSRGVYERVW